MLLGTRLTSYADPILGGFLFLQVAEVFLHMLGGWKRFWFGKLKKRLALNGAWVNRQSMSYFALNGQKPSKSFTNPTAGRASSMSDLEEEEGDEETDVDARNNYQISANRFDFAVITISLMMIIGTSFIGVAQHTDNIRQDEHRYTFAVNVGMRLAVTFPVLRLLSVVHSTRRLVFGLLKRASTFAPICALILLTMYIFAVFGVWLYGGQFRRLSDDAYDLAPATFDSFSTALTTLFLVMEGEQWHVVSYAAMDARNSLVPITYFVLFVIVNGLLFTNLFIGVLCDTFSEVEDKELEKAREEQKKIEKDEDVID